MKVVIWICSGGKKNRKYLLIVVISYLILILFGCANNADTKSLVPATPEIPEKCLLGGCINDQFYGKINSTESYYYVVLSKETDLKVKPSKVSSTIGKLYPPSQVIIQYKSNAQSKNNNINGNWIYIQTFNYSEGWILDDSIAYKSMFKPDHSFNGKKIEYSYGDTNYDFVFTGSNHYRGKWISTYPADKGKSGKVFGKLYRYKDILYFDSVQSDHKLFILLCDSGKDEGCMLKIIN